MTGRSLLPPGPRRWLRRLHPLIPYATGSPPDERRRHEWSADADPIGGPVPELPLTAARRAALRRQAEEDGARDAASGMYDQWTFATGTTVPYLVELDRSRAAELEENRIHRSRDAHRIEADLAADRRRLSRAELVTAELEDDLRRAKEREERLLGVLDGRTEDPVAQRWARWAGSGAPSRNRWRTRVFRWAVLGVFMAVELPIQYATFDYFGENSTLTWAFVAGTAAAMLLAPHLAGGWTRRLRAREAGLAVRLTLLVTAPAWGCAVVILADLRRRTLLATRVDAQTGAPVPSPVSDLALDPLVVTLLFLALMALTGAVAFAFGYLGENPYAAELASARAARRRAARRLSRARGLLAGVEHIADGADRRRSELAARWDARDASVEDFYAGCAARYRHALAVAARDPAFSESVGDRPAHPYGVSSGTPG